MTAPVPGAEGAALVTVWAPAGIAEVGPGTDLAAVITDALDADPGPLGALADGDLLVVTSKIISKQEGREHPAEDRAALITTETVRSVARRRSMAIVETPHGLVQAAAGVDNSNVGAGRILALPADPDASAARLLDGLTARTGRRLGVVVSDTAGRAWRLGQTDHAIGAAGVLVVDSYDGRTDAYGNALHVTAVAIADEVAGAADLAKRKLAGRPVAVVRGLDEFVLGPATTGSSTTGSGTTARPTTARALLRPGPEDLFAYGVREAVLEAVLSVLGRSADYERVARLEDPADVRTAVLEGLDPADPRTATLAALVDHALRHES